ncbi:MAG: pyruvate dehydrogenase complex dihydrolipoamide acetyltransferase [Rickettsiales bacterium]|nr:pyruvate dehydrogenase complex dihydrolipoamide acetyltransferase [Rickettsiales bacterium]
MPIEILMPALSPTMKEGNLAKWLKSEGDQVSSGDVIAEIETDKATMEVEAVDDGTLGKIIIAEGSKNVAVNSVIAVLLEDGESKDSLKNFKPANKAEEKNEQEDAAKKAEKTSSIVKEEEKKQPTNSSRSKTEQKQNIAKTVTTITRSKDVNSDVKISPVAKRIAAMNNIDISNIQASGPKNRVIKSDVINHMSAPASSDKIFRDENEYNIIENNNIRQVIAERLLEAKQTIPHFYLSLDCNISELLQIRSQINNNANIDESGKPIYKISVNDLIIKASALALNNVPQVNASWNNDSILQYNNIDISVAVSIDDGLITPIIQNAEQKTIFNISKEMKLLASKARAGTLAPHEFQGGGFSISNLGMYGITQFNAIVNPPQSAILSVGAASKKVVFDKQNNLQSIDSLTLSLSCDHRVVDGAIGAKFLQSLQYFLENPVLLVM